MFDHFIQSETALSNGFRTVDDEYQMAVDSIIETVSRLRNQGAKLRLVNIENLWRSLTTGIQNHCSCSMRDKIYNVDSKGNVFNCNATVGNAKFIVGNVAQPALDKQIQHSEVGQAIRGRTCTEIVACRVCKWRFLCGGGCMYRGYMRTGNINAESDCNFMQSTLENLIRRNANGMSPFTTLGQND